MSMALPPSPTKRGNLHTSDGHIYYEDASMFSRSIALHCNSLNIQNQYPFHLITFKLPSH